MSNIFYLPEVNKTNKVDVILITGDAYIDHPSFGISVIARLLNDAGYSVCIVSQPEYFNPESLNILPEPELFIGISAGNLDSVVSNYTSNRHRRKKDAYSIDGKTQFDNGKSKRPDRACITYTSYVKQRFKDIPIVLGGIEASLRRFAHYDYVQQKLRKSILVDSKADILVYSMGERAILEIAQRLSKSQDLFGIDGTCVKTKREHLPTDNTLRLPSYEDIRQDKRNLLVATATIEANMVNTGKSITNQANNLYQEQGNGLILCFKPQPVLTTDELDKVYSLPFRKDFPNYCSRVPAWEMIKTSITSHRGCYGRCSFCAISSHQSPVVISRTKKSLQSEATKLSRKKFFKGTISDIGGATANMYASYCKIGWCKNPHCLYPTICKNLVIDESYKSVLEAVKSLSKVKHVFVSSGIRFDIAMMKQTETEWIIKNATSGHFKVAPEHIDNEVLRLMKKPSNKSFTEFIRFFERIKRKYRLRFYLLPYVILSHPGSDTNSARSLLNFLNRHHLKTYQFQDFTPTPQTISTAMFFCGEDLDGNIISVPNPSSLKNPQRRILEKN